MKGSSLDNGFMNVQSKVGGYVKLLVTEVICHCRPYACGGQQSAAWAAGTV